MHFPSDYTMAHGALGQHDGTRLIQNTLRCPVFLAGRVYLQMAHTCGAPKCVKLKWSWLQDQSDGFRLRQLIISCSCTHYTLAWIFSLLPSLTGKAQCCSELRKNTLLAPNLGEFWSSRTTFKSIVKNDARDGAHGASPCVGVPWSRDLENYSGHV